MFHIPRVLNIHEAFGQNDGFSGTRRARQVRVFLSRYEEFQDYRVPRGVYRGHQDVEERYAGFVYEFLRFFLPMLECELAFLDIEKIAVNHVLAGENNGLKLVFDEIVEFGAMFVFYGDAHGPDVGVDENKHDVQ